MPIYFVDFDRGRLKQERHTLNEFLTKLVRLLVNHILCYLAKSSRKEMYLKESLLYAHVLFIFYVIKNKEKRRSNWMFTAGDQHLLIVPC